MKLWVILAVFVLVRTAQGQTEPAATIELATPTPSASIRTVFSTHDSAFIRVVTSSGTPQIGLSSLDFIVHDDRDTANITSCTEVSTETTKDISISFIFDNSGSMFGAYDSLTKYADAFIDSLDDGFIANALTFDDIERKPNFEATQRGTMYIALSGFTSSRQELKDFWHFYDTVRSSFTPLNDGLVAALENIRHHRKATGRERKDIIIVVTDGSDNASKTTLSTLQDLINALGVTIYTLSFYNEPSHKLSYLARKTGGRHFDCYTIQNVRKVLDDIRRNISHGYKLTYSFPFRGPASSR